VILGNALLGLLCLALAGAGGGARDKACRWIAGAGIASGLGLVIFRSSLGAWRGFDPGVEVAAVAGLAVACSWGLVIALELGDSRWWIGGLVAVTSSSLVACAASVWVVPALLFGIPLFAATQLAAARTARTAWLAFALADAGLIAVLVSDSVSRGEWSAPGPMTGWLVIPLMVSSALRAGALPRVGTLGTVGRVAAALGPLSVGLSIVVVLRWVSRPQPAAAAVAVVIALAVVACSVLRRKLDPAVVGAWPVAFGGALVLASEAAGLPAAAAAIIGCTAIILWPAALERGRLSRGFVLSGVAPTIAFGAIATAARDAFAHATAGGLGSEVAAWIVLAALLPVASAAGVALGVFAARAERSGGYHPEAVFMTWVLAAGSVAAGLLLGADAVYGVLGGVPAAILFAVAIAFGAVAAARTDAVRTDPEWVSAEVLSTPPALIGRWVGAAPLVVGLAAVASVAWLTIKGLEVGFL
jgi:hypothetical protein